MNPAEDYILRQSEPYQSIMLYVRSVILRSLDHIDEKYNYSIPFYHYKKKPFIYLNILKGQKFVDVAFVRGSQLDKDFPALKNYKKRKNVRSLQYASLEDVNEEELITILMAAAQITDKGRTGWYD